MLTEQELKEKVQDFIKEHADVCFEVEMQRQRVLQRIRIAYISIIILAFILAILSYYFPAILPVVLMLPIPVIFVLITPMLEGKKPKLKLHKELRVQLLDEITRFLFKELSYRPKEEYLPVVEEEPTNPFGIKPIKVTASHVIYGEVNHLSIFFCKKSEFIADLFSDSGDYTGTVFLIDLKPFQANTDPDKIADISTINQILAKLYPLFSNRIPTFRALSETQFQIIGPLEKDLFPIYRKLKIYNPESLLPIFKQIYYLFHLVEVLDEEVNGYES